MEINLCGTWRFKCMTDQTYREGIVPGSVYHDLLTNGLIPDPFFRDHEDAVLPFSDFDYEYHNTFKLTTCDYEELLLVCEGIDTLSTLFINDQVVGHTHNMHRGYTFDIKPFLQLGENHIKIVLHSPTQYIKDAHTKEPIFHCPGVVDGYTHLRKAHYMFGWDWGPQLPDLGIWQPIKIVGRNHHISDYYIKQIHQDNQVTLEISVTATMPHLIAVEVTSPDGQKYFTKGPKSTITITNPQLWWHNGYGKQPLYDVAITLGEEDCKRFKIGLRQLGIKKEKDAWGEKFCFILNGKEIFAMGSNYIPEDNLLARTTEEKTHRLLSDCANAGHNCIRVWGGGIYPPDYFYEICDELGLIVWQDFMYACSLYNFETLEEEIEAETIYQIKRLRHHSCIALWCGNNEQEEAWVYWGWSKDIASKYKEDYIKQFEQFLPTLIQTYDPERFYWPSSPSSGGGFEEPRAEHAGDMHYWLVWHGLKPFESYKNHYFRFVTEYGFQSFPSLKTINTFTDPSDRNIFSYVMEKHQKNKQANGIILHYLSAYYRYPYSLERIVYLSQLLQAEAMRYGAEHWRRNRGRCMGALYWQTNDCWPVASWSGIDYYGRWKALHYKSKHFFAPLLLSADIEDTTVHLVLINDSADTFCGEMKWELVTNEGHVISSGSQSICAQSLDKSTPITMDFENHIPDYTSKMDKVFHYQLFKDDHQVSDAHQLFIKPKHFNYMNPHVTLTQISPLCFEVRTATFAHEIWLDHPTEDFRWSDNCFSLTAGQVKRITCDKPITVSEIQITTVFTQE
ncbi:MAG: beta-mannosidase [Cellulosilyticaceae bacterium]